MHRRSQSVVMRQQRESRASAAELGSSMEHAYRRAVNASFRNAKEHSRYASIHAQDTSGIPSTVAASPRRSYDEDINQEYYWLVRKFAGQLRSPYQQPPRAWDALGYNHWHEGHIHTEWYPWPVEVRPWPRRDTAHRPHRHSAHAH